VFPEVTGVSGVEADPTIGVDGFVVLA